MSYVPQTWNNNDPTTPISAARLNYIESGIGTVSTQVGGLSTVATTGSYTDLLNKPSLATVASTGAYSDLTGKPTFATVATSGNYADLAGKPTLSTVASTGSYTDLTNQPTIPTITSLNAVPNSRTINGYQLTSNITLSATDVSAVPTTTTVNSHALSSNVTITASDIGLANVNNTSDASKPISTAQAAANLVRPQAVVVTTGSETRPTGSTLVFWVAGPSYTGAAPTNMTSGDLWFPRVG